MSYLHHPNTMVSRPAPSDRVHERTFALRSGGGEKATKSAPYMDDGLNLAGFDIWSIDTHHETPNESSRLSRYDGVASLLTLYRWVRTSRRRRKSGAKPSKSGLYMNIGLCHAQFDIRYIETHHETPDEPSKSPRDEVDASLPLLSGVQKHPRPGVRNRQNQSRTFMYDDNVRILASDLSHHVPRRLVNYLDHQKTAVSCPSPSLPVAARAPRPGGETVEISPVRSYKMIPCGVWHQIYQNTSRDVY